MHKRQSKIELLNNRDALNSEQKEIISVLLKNIPRENN